MMKGGLHTVTLMASKWINNYSLFILPLTLVFLPLIVERRVRLRHFAVDVRLHRPDGLHQVLAERVERPLFQQVPDGRVGVGAPQLLTERHRRKALHAARLYVSDALIHRLATTRNIGND